jgi:hypothetical protein
MNMPLAILNRRRKGGAASTPAFSPSLLFASSEPGVWYDPSDLTTLFTDTAGTTPVTTPGQTVALMNDKSGRGNNATQATAASRPTYGVEPKSGRRNLLLQTEAFSVSPWTVTNASLSAGSSSESRIVTATANNASIQQFTTVLAGTYTNSIQIRRVTGTGNIIFRLPSASQPAPVTVTSSWSTFSTTGPSGSAVNYFVLDIATSGDAVEIRYPQIESGSIATNYQKVTTARDVTEAGVQSLSYLFFDGASDFMVTPTITPGTDKVQVFAGVRKLSDAARGTIVEHSATIASNNGAFHLTAPNAASATFGFESKGTTLTDATATFAAPTTRVVTGIGDIAGDSAIIRVNGTQQDQDTGDQGTGNYLAYPMYVGSRGGTTLPLNGNIFSLIVRFGANLTTPQITDTETWVNGKTGAYT